MQVGTDDQPCEKLTGKQAGSTESDEFTADSSLCDSNNSSSKGIQNGDAHTMANGVLVNGCDPDDLKPDAVKHPKAIDDFKFIPNGLVKLPSEEKKQKLIDWVLKGDICTHVESIESKPKAEELKPKVEELKPKEEVKPKVEELKPKVEELKPIAEELKPKADESKVKVQSTDLDVMLDKFTTPAIESVVLDDNMAPSADELTSRVNGNMTSRKGSVSGEDSGRDSANDDLVEACEDGNSMDFHHVEQEDPDDDLQMNDDDSLPADDVSDVTRPSADSDGGVINHNSDASAVRGLLAKCVESVADGATSSFTRPVCKRRSSVGSHPDQAEPKKPKLEIKPGESHKSCKSKAAPARFKHNRVPNFELGQTDLKIETGMGETTLCNKTMIRRCMRRYTCSILAEHEEIVTKTRARVADHDRRVGEMSNRLALLTRQVEETLKAASIQHDSAQHKLNNIRPIRVQQRTVGLQVNDSRQAAFLNRPQLVQSGPRQTLPVLHAVTSSAPVKQRFQAPFITAPQPRVPGQGPRIRGPGITQQSVVVGGVTVVRSITPSRFVISPSKTPAASGTPIPTTTTVLSLSAPNMSIIAVAPSLRQAAPSGGNKPSSVMATITPTSTPTAPVELIDLDDEDDDVPAAVTSPLKSLGSGVTIQVVNASSGPNLPRIPASISVIPVSSNLASSNTTRPTASILPRPQNANPTAARMVVPTRAAGISSILHSNPAGSTSVTNNNSPRVPRTQPLQMTIVGVGRPTATITPFVLPAPPPQPPNPAASTTLLIPPKPTVKASKVQTGSGVVLSWNMTLTDRHADVTNYDVFAYQENPNQADIWRSLGSVKAMSLPMACTLTHLTQGFKYHFVIRAKDRFNRVGPFGDPASSEV